MRLLPLSAVLAVLLLTALLHAQTPLDSDHDGLSDDLEQSLLNQFAPTFMIARQDCSNIPAEFEPQILTPKVVAENGTIYAQASPVKDNAINIELHYYHLWRTDCGPHGHPLDAEHVSVLIHPIAGEKWKALYWYSAAHENTVCDVSQITRASTLRAENHGATIWISPGKHASYLNQALCRRGCGADRCEAMTQLNVKQIINLGEQNHPMNSATWSSSIQWPLAAKMTRSDFPAAPIARLETLPDTDIAWFNAGRHPSQQIIAVSSTTAGALDTSRKNTVNAIDTGGDNTLSAISVAGDSTGNALGKSYRNTVKALGTSARHVGTALHLNPKPESSKPESPKSESKQAQPATPRETPPLP